MNDYPTPHRCPRCGDWLSYGRCRHGCLDADNTGLAEETERLGTFPAKARSKLFAEERSR